MCHFFVESIDIRRIEHNVSWRSDKLNIMIPLEGSLGISAGQESLAATELSFSFFTRGEIVLSADESCRILFILLRPEAVLSLTDGERFLAAPLQPFTEAQTEDAKKAGLKLMQLLSEQNSSRHFQEDASLLTLLQVLNDHCPKMPPLFPPKFSLTKRRAALYQSILNYMKANYNRKISQIKTAEVFRITPQYLGNFLKETSGFTFRECLAGIRDHMKETYQIYTVLTEEEIVARINRAETIIPVIDPGVKDKRASLPGISDAGLPSAFRQLSFANSLTHPDLKYVKADVSLRKSAQNFITKLINLGYAPDLVKLDLSTLLSRTEKEIGFSYGRICRITDLIRSYRSGKRIFFDYTSVFRLLDQLLSHHIIPFLELGNKQFIIQAANSGILASSRIESSADYYQRLIELLPEFMGSCVNRYGQSEVDRWRFEVSYNYTNPKEKESFTYIQYMKSFRKIRSILHSCSPGCQIGGPGFNEWSSPDEVDRMLQLFSSHDSVPDFFTAYLYPIEKNVDGSLFISADSDFLFKKARIFAERVRRRYPEKEIWFTEMNSNLSARNYLNDSPYQAAFLVKLVIDLYDLPVSAVGYYLLSDAPLRYMDTLDLLFGGWGLFTDTNLEKPSCYAFRLMNMLGQYPVVKAPGILVTANSRGHIQILLTRFSQPGKAFRNRNVEKEDLFSYEQVFENPGRDHIYLRLQNVISGTYIVKEYRITPGHSDLLTVWKKLHFLSPQEPDICFREASLIPQTSVCQVGTDGIFNMDVILTDLDVRLIVCELHEDSPAS